MHQSKLKRISLAVCFALMPLVANAAGLGKLTVMSGLGEPLRAEIELLSATPEELSSLTVAIAPEEAYTLQGVERTALHSAIKLEVGRKADGSPILKLSTHQPVSDPFLDMLIQVDWSTGRLLREYTVLLDPPGYSSEQAATESPGVPAQTEAQPEGVPEAQSAMPASEPPLKKNDSESYTTKRGDSLIGIAKEMQTQDVSLEQMLVGIYRANKSAFVGRNMNRLKVGQIIRAPSAEELQSISPKEARQEMRVQTADWNAYRNKLASAVAESASASEESPSQSAGGKITAPAEDKAAPASKGPRDVVKLSKNDTAAGEAAGGNKAMQEKLNSLQEDVTAREKSVKEANERNAALEKQIQDMQKLLEVKSQAMAELQKNASEQTARQQADAANAAATAQSPAVQPPVAAEPIKPPEAQPQVSPATPETATTDTKPEADKPAAKKKIIVPPPAPLEEPGLLDGLMQDPVLISGVGGALALLGGAWLFLRNKRRRELDSFEQGILTSGGLKANTVFGNTAQGTVDTSNTSFLTDFSQSTGGMIDTHDVDPIAEAEVYMAYGRNAQAEEILKDAIAKEPKRYELHLKLLEIYAGRNDSSAFETIAGELYSTLGSSDPTWIKIAEIGHKMEPNNPLYEIGDTSVRAHSTQAAVDTSNSANGTTKSASTLDLSLGAESASKPFFESEKQAEQASALDFDLGVAETAAPEAALPEINLSDSEFMGTDEPQTSGNDLDFQLDLTEQAAPNTVQLDVSDFGHTLPAIEMPAHDEPSLDMPPLDMPAFDLPDLTSTPPSEPAKPGVELSLPDLNFDLPETGSENTTVSFNLPEEAPSLELPDFGQSTATQPGVNVEEIVFEAMPADANGLDLNFDMEIGGAEMEPVAESKPGTAPEVDLSAISLDFEPAPGNAAEETGISNGESPEVDTKLDLVTAYLDMDDKEGALELLDEVLKEGGPLQRQRAQQIMSSLT